MPLSLIRSDMGSLGFALPAYEKNKFGVLKSEIRFDLGLFFKVKLGFTCQHCP